MFLLSFYHSMTETVAQVWLIVGLLIFFLMALVFFFASCRDEDHSAWLSLLPLWWILSGPLHCEVSQFPFSVFSRNNWKGTLLCWKWRMMTLHGEKPPFMGCCVWRPQISPWILDTGTIQKLIGHYTFNDNTNNNCGTTALQENYQLDSEGHAIFKKRSSPWLSLRVKIYFAFLFVYNQAWQSAMW